MGASLASDQPTELERSVTARCDISINIGNIDNKWLALIIEANQSQLHIIN